MSDGAFAVGLFALWCILWVTYFFYKVLFDPT